MNMLINKYVSLENAGRFLFIYLVLWQQSNLAFPVEIEMQGCLNYNSPLSSKQEKCDFILFTNLDTHS